MKKLSCLGVLRQTLQTMSGLALVLAFCCSGSAQAAGPYPSYNTKPLPADMSGMSDDAARMRPGWNVGNTMEAVGGETAWGNPLVSNSLIQLVKKNGFNAIRLPVAWDQYADQKTGKISDTWLARVKQVVQHCVDNDMYVLVNIHWDGGWLQENFTADKQAAVNARQKAYWEQIATLLRDYDSHVYWDTGDVGPNSFGLFDRKNNKVADQQTVNAMREGAYGL